MLRSTAPARSTCDTPSDDDGAGNGGGGAYSGNPDALHSSNRQRVATAQDEGLLSGLLEVRCYVHGSRSLKKVAYFLQRRGKPGAYRFSDLPAPALLEPHVDLAEVLRIARARLPISCLVTRLAPAIHASYSKHAAGSKQPDLPRYVAGSPISFTR